jgi:hypothetical protein
MTPLRRSWARWLRTRRLSWTVRRLRRKVRRQEKVLLLQLEYLRLLEQLEHPLMLVPPELLPTAPQPPVPQPLNPPDQLTPEEIEELRALPMPDPLEEIQLRLASTTPPSPPISVG